MVQASHTGNRLKQKQEAYRVLPPVNKLAELDVLVIVLVQQLDGLLYLQAYI